MCAFLGSVRLMAINARAVFYFPEMANEKQCRSIRVQKTTRALVHTLAHLSECGFYLYAIQPGH